MFCRLKFVVAVLALALPCLAADAGISTPAPANGVAVLRNGFTLEFDHREILDHTTRLYLSSGNESYIDVASDQIADYLPGPPRPAAIVPPPPAPAPTLEEIVNSAGNKHSLDVDFIRAVIRAESDFNIHAVSRKGARGLMQLMPDTASRLGVKDSFDPAANVDGGVRYLRELLEQYHGDVAKALAAYNAGPHRVAQYKGVPPYRETRAYVARIIREYNRKKLAERTAAATVSHQFSQPSP